MSVKIKIRIILRPFCLYYDDRLILTTNPEVVTMFAQASIAQIAVKQVDYCSDLP